jgi:hypothetical protein
MTAVAPAPAATLNGFSPGPAKHAAQPELLTALPTTPPTGAAATLPSVPAQGYRSVPASETILGHLGGSALALLLGGVLIVIAALRIRALRRRRQHV